MKYVKLYTDALSSYRRLSDTEFGRAIRALLQYVEDGTEASLPGKESIMFDVLREQVERDKAAYNTRVENGSKGGRKPKPKETEGNRTVNLKTETPQDKEEEYIPPYNPPTGEVGGEDELLAISKQHNRVYDKAQACGFVCSTATLDRLTDLIADHGADAVFSALDECVKAQASNFRYLEKVLENRRAEAKPKTWDYL